MNSSTSTDRSPATEGEQTLSGRPIENHIGTGSDSGVVKTISAGDTKFKTASRWASFIKDVLSSVKDLGIIGFVVAIVFFRDPVLQYLERTGLKVNKVNFLGGLELQIATLSAFAEAETRPSAAQTQPGQGSAPPILKSPTISPQLARVEQTILNAQESTLVKDWAVVISGYPSLPMATESAKAAVGQVGREITIFKKRSSFRLVAQIGTRDEVATTLKHVRSAFPASYLVSLSSWCGEFQPQGDFVLCSNQ